MINIKPVAVKILVPSPCNQDWNAMTPQKNGKHCSFCDKVVVDFTSMEKEEINHYFKNYSNQKICGHFLNSQMANNEVEANRYQHLNLLKEKFQKINFSPLRFLSLLLIGVLMTFAGCNQRTTGEAKDCTDPELTSDTINDTNHNKIDTIGEEMTGEDSN